MAGKATDLYDLCREYLNACIAAVDASPGGPIARSFVAPGPPAWDCEQITVYAGGPAEGDTAPMTPPMQPAWRTADAGTLNMVSMTATVLRCVPIVDDQGRLPAAQALDIASQVTLGDVWSIWNTVRGRYRKGILFARNDGEKRELMFGPAVALNPQGGFAGWQVEIRVQLDGYPGAV